MPFPEDETMGKWVPRITIAAYILAMLVAIAVVAFAPPAKAIHVVSPQLVCGDYEAAVKVAEALSTDAEVTKAMTLKIRHDKDFDCREFSDGFASHPHSIVKEYVDYDGQPFVIMFVSDAEGVPLWAVTPIEDALRSLHQSGA